MWAFARDIEKGELLVFISSISLSPEAAAAVGGNHIHLLLRARDCSLVYLTFMYMESIG